MSFIFTILGTIIGLLILFIILFPIIVDKMLYRPDPSYIPGLYFSEYFVSNIHVCLTRKVNAGDCIFIYFHGNAETMTNTHSHITYFSKKLHAPIISFDYPGYGTSKGEPSYTSTIDAANVVVSDVQIKYPNNRIIFYGYSLGTAIAACIAPQYNIKYLILECPFYSVASMLTNYTGIPENIYNFLERRYRLYEYLSRVRAPVIMGYSRNDEIIPCENSARLSPYCSMVIKFDRLHCDDHIYGEWLAALHSCKETLNS